jgi:hypothetical protein
MPDWNALLRDRLGNLALPAPERDEVIAELATHLQESYEGFLRRGIPETEAFEQALSGLGDLESLTQDICRAKKEGQYMGDRMKTFWLPGLAALAAFNLLWMVILRAELAPHLFDFGTIIVPVYVPLLLAMPLFGALGAYLSARAGGSRSTRFAAGLFPLFAVPAAVLSAVGAGMVFNLNLSSTAHATPGAFPTRLAVAIVVLSGIVVQSAALLLGAFPFLRAFKRGRPTT